jgi:hypothetical protein
LMRLVHGLIHCPIIPRLWFFLWLQWVPTNYLAGFEVLRESRRIRAIIVRSNGHGQLIPEFSSRWIGQSPRSNIGTCSCSA